MVKLILLLMFAPLVISAIGLGLSELLSCSGGAGQINHCKAFPTLGPMVNDLASIGLPAMITIPGGTVLLVLYALFVVKKEVKKKGEAE